MATKTIPKDELVALRKRKIAAMTEEDWKKQWSQVGKRDGDEDYEKFVQRGIAEWHKERAEQTQS